MYIKLTTKQAGRILAYLAALKNRNNNGITKYIERDIQSLKDKIINAKNKIKG